MVFQIARLLIAGFIVLSIVYFIVSLYSRSVRRGKLEREWDEEVQTGDREAYIRQGLEEYRNSVRRKAILLIYIIPMLVFIGVIYVQNFM